jgi:hypothetical protein
MAPDVASSMVDVSRAEMSVFTYPSLNAPLFLCAQFSFVIVIAIMPQRTNSGKSSIGRELL